MNVLIAASLYILATILYGIWAFGTDNELYYKLKDIGNIIRELGHPSLIAIVFLFLFLVVGLICLLWPIWILESLIRATISMFRRPEK